MDFSGISSLKQAEKDFGRHVARNDHTELDVVLCLSPSAVGM